MSTQSKAKILSRIREGLNKTDYVSNPPKGKDKGKAPPKGAPAAVEEEEAPPIEYPKAESHVNVQIKDFLDHFASSRRIVQSSEAARKRDDEEKQKILADFESEMTADSERFSAISEEREKLKESRQTEREEAFKDISERVV